MKTMLQSQIAESNIAINTLMNRDVNTTFEIDTIITIKNYSQTINITSDLYILDDHGAIGIDIIPIREY